MHSFLPYELGSSRTRQEMRFLPFSMTLNQCSFYQHSAHVAKCELGYLNLVLKLPRPSSAETPSSFFLFLFAPISLRSPLLLLPLCHATVTHPVLVRCLCVLNMEYPPKNTRGKLSSRHSSNIGSTGA